MADTVSNGETMGSDQETSKVPTDAPTDKDDMWVSVKLSVEDEKDMRRAAVEVNQSRSDFMAEASIRRMREVLNHTPAQRTA